MPSGRLGAAVLVANTNTALFNCPVNKTGTFNLYLINNTAAEAQVKVAIVDGNLAALAAEDWIDMPIDKLAPNGGTYRLTGEPIGNGATSIETVVVWSDKAIIAHARGFIGNPVSGEA